MKGALDNPRPVDDIPVNGQLEHGVSSNRMFDHEASLDAHTLNPLDTMLVGRYLSYSGPHTTSTAIATAQYRLYAMLLVVARNMSFDQVAIDIETADAGKDIRLGLYTCSAALVPTTLLNDFGTVDTDSAVIKALGIPSLSLAKGRYFLAAITDSNTVVKWIATLPTGGGLGIATTFGRAYSGYYINLAAPQFAALPDPFGAPTLNEYSPKVALRLESLD